MYLLLVCDMIKKKSKHTCDKKIVSELNSIFLFQFIIFLLREIHLFLWPIVREV